MEKQFSRRDFLRGSLVFGVGAFGATALAGCAPKTASSEKESSSPATQSSSSNRNKVTLHRGYGAAHGTKCFTQAVVAVKEDGTIIAVSIDDYQFMDGATEGIKPVPNADADFGAGFASGSVLISKTDNDEVYSKHMAEKASATQKWVQSMQAVEKFAIGKKPSELKGVGIDAVTGSTLADTVNYLGLVAQVAEDEAIVSEGVLAGDGSSVSLGRVNASVHGKASFGNAVSLVESDVIVATSIDEFQFFDTTVEGIKGVPNSDADFAQGYAEGKILASKSVNSDVYSQMLKSKANATTNWIDSMKAIESFVAGKKISEAVASGPDAVSGSTLKDTANYVAGAVEAAKQA